VAVFFLLSGYVAALKPLSLVRNGHVEAALEALASSARRRTLRLMLPAAAATVLSWALCQLGAFETGRWSDGYWLYANSPPPSRTWHQAVWDLCSALKSTWAPGAGNVYDQPQWALVWLWLGSMVGYGTLLVTIPMGPGWRAGVLVGLAWWSVGWTMLVRDRKSIHHARMGKDVPTHAALVGLTTLTGVLLASLTLTPPAPLHLFRLPNRLIHLPLILLPPALLLMSYPSTAPLAAPWSARMTALLAYLPPISEPSRLLGTVGAALLLACIALSPFARRALTTRPALRLGRGSFAIYLLHGTVLRSVLAWALFAGADLRDMEVDGPAGPVVVSRYPIPGPVRITFAVLAALAVLGAGVAAWLHWVEGWCGRVAAWVEGRMERHGRGEGRILGFKEALS
jgi:peptidoglycan/LPS O-acetylase OafA/YrhL